MHSKNQKRHSSPVPSHSPLVPTKPKALAGTPGSGGDAMTFRVPKDYPHSRFSKAPLAVYPPKGARSKPCVSLPVVSLEKMPCLGRAHTTSSQVRLYSSSPSPGDKLANGRCAAGAPSSPHSSSSSSSSSSSTDRRTGPVRSPLDRRPDCRPPPSPSRRAGVPPLHTSQPERKAQSGTKPSSTRTHCRLSGSHSLVWNKEVPSTPSGARVFDPNKHCGVQDPESKRPCTRSLTCKTHSLTHRRAVPGRRKHFDVLLAEHKGRAKDKDEDRDAVKEKEGDAIPGKKEVCSQSVASQDTTSPSKPHCPNSRRLSTLKLRFANAHIPRVPGSTSTSLPTAPVPAWTSDPFPHSWSRTPGDSDEGDPEALEERPAYRYSTHHPRPLACCVFSSRRMGRGHYVFDRRWDRIRLALRDVVEKHLNAQMWRKVPLAAESSSVPSGTSSHLQRPPVSPYPTSVTPSLLSPFQSSSDCLSYTAIFPQSSSVAGVFSVREAPASACGKPPAAPHKASRASRCREDSLGGAKRRKSTLASPSSVDNLKPNGSSCHPAFQGPGLIKAAPAQKNGLGHGDSRLASRQEAWLSSVDGSHSNGTPHMLDVDSLSLASRKEPASVSPLSPTPTSGPLVYRGGGADGRKRSRPTSYGEAPSKLSQLSGLDSLFRKGNSNGGILAAGLYPPQTG